ncbi:MAG: hypothetical protein QNJ65_22450 [Xenococcaceae cyanobacterium MO_234.B1]|nr:hypothetical protein [Xenococcaceae cyanobacterium MO_234.B1]
MIEAVHEYWRGQPQLTTEQINILSSYLFRWISESTTEYPKKEQHLAEAKACQNIEELKILTNRLMDWGIDPW